MKDKRLIVGICIVGIAVVCILIFLGVWNRRVTMVSASKDDIKAVTVTNGNNGDMIELSSEDWNDLIELCSKTSCKREHRPESGGWSYSIDITGGTSSTKVTLISKETCVINSVDYRMDAKDGEAILSLIEKLYEKSNMKS